MKKLVFLSGKLYYDLDKQRDDHFPEDRAFIRMEQLYPLNEKGIQQVLKRYPKNVELYWAQEEPGNMGAAWFIAQHFPHKLNGILAQDPSASPAAGSAQLAMDRQEKLLSEILNV